jgi:type I restriction-modification system DNA methylase subunit
MNEWEFTALVTTWVTALVQADNNSPFQEARTEQRANDWSAERRDFTLLDKNGLPILTGEFKLPDKADGATPFNTAVVDGARRKAAAAGVAFFITWNVNECVLWETNPTNPAAVRQDYKHWNVANIRRSAQLQQDEIQRNIRGWLPVFLRDVAAALRGANIIEQKAPDAKFIDAFEAAMRQPVALTSEALAQQYARTAPRREIDEWMRSDLGFTIVSDAEGIRDNLENAAKHACYTLATRLIFHEALLRRYGAEMPQLNAPAHINTPDKLRLHFQQFFEDAKRVTGDYETVFGTSPLAVGNRVPFYAGGILPYWRAFVEEIHAFDFSRLDYEVIGSLFERLIGPEERHKFGQYYTRAEVVDLMLSFAIHTGEETVMDPACGGGTFLVRAYARKRELAAGHTHAQRLEDIYGVDLSAYAVNLTTINLATRDLDRDENYPRVVRSDFFDVPIEGKFMHLPRRVQAAGLGASQTRDIQIPPLDVIVGNPPYVRQEEVERKDAYASLIGLQRAKFSKRADLHAYFWPQSTAFLKENGYLCFLTSSQWLDVDYGFALQAWILANFEVIAIFESVGEPWFVGARVMTAATILRRQRNEETRNANVVRFVQFQAPVAELLMNDGSSAGAVQVANSLRDEILSLTADDTNKRYRARLVPQGQLWAEGVQMGNLNAGEPGGTDPARYVGKWGRYLRAPELWFDLVQQAGDRLTPLAGVVRIRRGVTSGKDEFFMPKDATAEALAAKPDAREFQVTYGANRAEVAAGTVRIVACGDKFSERRPIEACYLEPEVHNLKDITRMVVSPTDCARLIILIPSPIPADTYAARYIAWGEEKGWNRASTTAQRATAERGWYDLIGHRRGQMFWPMSQQYRHAVPLNEHDLICNHNLFDLHVAEGVDQEVLAGILNSSWTVFSKFQYGRPVGNEGNLKTEVIDVNLMLVADPRAGTPKARQRVSAAFRAMQDRTQLRFLSEQDFQETAYRNRGQQDQLSRLSTDSELTQADRRELDDAVLEMLGVTRKEERKEKVDALYVYLKQFFIQTRRKEELANANKKKAGSGKRVTPQSLALEIFQELREHHPALLRGYEQLLDLSKDFLTVDLMQKGSPSLAADAFVPNGIMFWQGKRRVGSVATEHPAQQQLVYHLAMSGRRLLTRVPMSVEGCEAVLRQHRQLLSNRNSTIQALAAERTTDPKLQQATLDKLSPLLPN